MKRVCFVNKGLKNIIRAAMLLLLFSGTATADIDLVRSSAWPFASAASYLKPAPNGVDLVVHHDYTDGILILAVGDTITVYNGTDLSLIRSFRVETSDLIHDFAYKETSGSETLYVAAGSGGLQIFDLSEIATPVLSGSFVMASDNPGYHITSDGDSEEQTEVNAMGAGYYDGTVFLADFNFGLRVVDVSDPQNPEEIALTSPDSDNYRISGYIQPNIYDSYEATGGYTNAEVIRYASKTYAFLLDYYYGLRVFDVTDPAVVDEPVSKLMRTNVLYGSIALVTDLYVGTGADSELYTCVTAVDVYGEESVVAKLKILDDSDELTEDCIVNIGRMVTPGDSDGVHFVEDTAFVADAGSGVRLVGLSTGEANDAGVLAYTETGAYETGLTYAMSTVVSGNRLFLTDTREGIVELDITDPSSPAFVRSVSTGISSDSLAYNDGYLYSLDADDGLRIFDHSSSSALSFQSWISISGITMGIAVSDGYAFIAAGDAGLRIFSVSDPESPSSVGVKDTAGTLTSVLPFTLDDTEYLLGADADGGVLTFNVTDPETPGDPVSVTTTGFTTDSAVDLAIAGTYACYADSGAGMKVFLLTGTPPFAVAGEKDTTGMAKSVAVLQQGDLYYGIVADDTDGILIENITDPTAIPETVAVIYEEGVVFERIRIEGNYLIAAAGEDGIIVYDLSDPALPSVLCRQEILGDAVDIAVYSDDTKLYIDSSEGSNGVNGYYATISEETVEPLSDGVDTGCFISASCQ